jgi:hypothetical protein
MATAASAHPTEPDTHEEESAPQLVLLDPAQVVRDSLRPALLRGLTVQERNRTGSRAGFLLDEESTRILRRDPRNTKYRIPEGTKRFRLPGSGIPIACLDLIEED